MSATTAGSTSFNDCPGFPSYSTAPSASQLASASTNLARCARHSAWPCLLLSGGPACFSVWLVSGYQCANTPSQVRHPHLAVAGAVQGLQRRNRTCGRHQGMCLLVMIYTLRCEVCGNISAIFVPLNIQCECSKIKTKLFKAIASIVRENSTLGLVLIVLLCAVRMAPKAPYACHTC
jgi:hypothetical protein